MINQNIIFRDYETGSKNCNKCQPLQLAAVAIDSRRLEIIPESVFCSYIKPEFDDKVAEQLGFDALQDEALKKNNITREQLKDAPQPKVVWKQYTDYLANYNIKGIGGGVWDNPIVAGFNNINFDDIIDERMCNLYGPKLDDYGGMTIYHPVIRLDAQMLVTSMFNNFRLSPTNKYSMDAVREYFGYKSENAHDAKVDVLQGADLLLRFLKLFRNLVDGKLVLPEGKKVKFAGCVGGKL
jgi:DNA polymerase III epsilon subunit-like protein